MRKLQTIVEKLTKVEDNQSALYLQMCLFGQFIREMNKVDPQAADYYCNRPMLTRTVDLMLKVPIE